MDTILLDDSGSSDADVLRCHVYALFCLNWKDGDGYILGLNTDALLRLYILLRDYNLLRFSKYTVLSALREDVDFCSFRKGV